MAEIKIERKTADAWPWILGVLLAGLLLWGLGELFDDDDVRAASVAPEVVEPTSTTPAVVPPGPGAWVPVAVMVTAPVSYVGQTVSGTARVAEVVSDRGFWLEQDGKRLFAVVREENEDAVNINAGQTVRLSGTVYDAATLSQVPGGLEAETRKIIVNQPLFLYVLPKDITILDQQAS